MRYEWDEAKREANLAKHGVDFRTIQEFDWQTSHARIDDRVAYGERRVVAYGLVNERLHAVVYTTRGQVRRIISMRRANRREQAAYAAAGNS